MKYRVRNNQNKFVYRTTIDAAVKVAAAKGSIVEAQESVYWHEVGLAYGGKFYDSRKYVDAFKLLKGWNGSFQHPQLGFRSIVEKGEIEFPARQCGLDNCLTWAKQTGAIRPGDRWNMDYKTGVYHYVATDYGRELAEIIRELFYV